jgi:general secretion pathway protein E
MVEERMMSEAKKLALFDDRPLGQVLKNMGVISEAEIAQALKVQKEKGGLLGEILVGQGAVASKDVARALAMQFGLEMLEDFERQQLDPILVEPFPLAFARQHCFAPLFKRRGKVVVALADPRATAILDDLAALYGAGVEPVVGTPETVMAALNAQFDRRTGAQQVMGDIEESADLGTIAHDLVETTKDLLDEDDEAPIIRLVNSILAQAVKEKASDIHFEPFEKSIVVRFRKDGVLHEVLDVPKKLQSSITSRVKIMGNLDIAEKRRPQDGRIRIRIAGRDVDIRLSTIPIAFGESLVLRLLDRSTTVLDLADLGLGGLDLERLQHLIMRPHGIILVTGPTGSGKTTTLYAALSSINSPDKKILTVEDPIEYQLTGINQMQVNPKIDVTFASALRSFLRQDPDVILVGEIRDRETVEIAIQASLTGHLVFSTVHTNDAPSTFTRLTDMGVEPFLIASTVISVIAQRLIRVLCGSCRQPMEASPLQLRQLGLNGGRPVTLYSAKGCPDCTGVGYAGRKGIFELLLVTDTIRDLVMAKANASEIRKAALKEGMSTLRGDGARKVLSGMTAIEEVLRVTQEDNLPV